MPLPAFRQDGWLPEGHHRVSWDEVTRVFGDEPGSRRSQVLAKLLHWRNDLRSKKITGNLILNGSFVSSKSEPGDVDCIFVYDEAGADILKVDTQAAELIDYSRCKQSGLGDVLAFPETTVRAYPALCRLDAFDFDKSGRPKGVVEVRI